MNVSRTEELTFGVSKSEVIRALRLLFPGETLLFRIGDIRTAVIERDTNTGGIKLSAIVNTTSEEINTRRNSLDVQA